ncbi:MAG: hypothetical protein QOG72_2671 [Sphingomonadales bacterium]|jgi:hypothetical protein|nr:hypothetical protein [Sphingomonadales bacterium]
MRAQADGMMLVRADLCERLARLEGAGRRLSERDYGESVEGIRRLAAAYGLAPVARLADAFGRALARDGGGCPRALYLGRLQDAIGCEAMEESAAEAMLASISVRLGG